MPQVHDPHSHNHQYLTLVPTNMRTSTACWSSCRSGVQAPGCWLLLQEEDLSCPWRDHCRLVSTVSVVVAMVCLVYFEDFVHGRQLDNYLCYMPVRISPGWEAVIPPCSTQFWRCTASSSWHDVWSYRSQVSSWISLSNRFKLNRFYFVTFHTGHLLT